MPDYIIEEQYLGDGLYVSFDGHHIKLRAPRSYGDHEIYLDPQVMVAFLKYLENLKQILGKTDDR